MQCRADILVVTFGKALGVSGAAILCDHDMGEYLTQFARHYVYSTALPPAQAYAVTYAIKMVQSQPWRREKLAELSAWYQEYLNHLPGFISTDTPIKPFMVGDSAAAMALAEQCQQQGLWLTAIRPPTVPKHGARLRITLTANHTQKQIQQLASILSQTFEERGVNDDRMW